MSRTCALPRGIAAGTSTSIVVGTASSKLTTAGAPPTVARSCVCGRASSGQSPTLEKRSTSPGAPLRAVSFVAVMRSDFRKVTLHEAQPAAAPSRSVTTTGSVSSCHAPLGGAGASHARNELPLTSERSRCSGHCWPPTRMEATRCTSRTPRSSSRAPPVGPTARGSTLWSTRVGMPMDRERELVHAPRVASLNLRDCALWSRVT
eukprot:3838203-Prymnesium_polylepis.2